MAESQWACRKCCSPRRNALRAGSGTAVSPVYAPPRSAATDLIQQRDGQRVGEPDAVALPRNSNSADRAARTSTSRRCGRNPVRRRAADRDGERGTASRPMPSPAPRRPVLPPPHRHRGRDRAQRARTVQVARQHVHHPLAPQGMSGSEHIERGHDHEVRVGRRWTPGSHEHAGRRHQQDPRRDERPAHPVTGDGGQPTSDRVTDLKHVGEPLGRVARQCARDRRRHRRR
jgi:hypothetical protein